MKPRIILRSKVPQDLAEIIDYLAERNPAVANRFADAARSTLEDLAQMPGMGSRKEFRLRKLRDVRSWSVTGFRNHLILYRPISDGIEVLGILHGAREIGRILKER